MKEDLVNEALRIAVAATGFACLVAGFALIFAPLGWICAGSACLFVAVDAKGRS